MKTFSLGMAQLGMKYGITSKGKEYDEEYAFELLKYAIEKKNVKMLDSARAYGRANKIIGKLKNGKAELKITNKVSGDSRGISKENDRKIWQKELEDLLEEMNINRLETLLIHRSNNMDKENENLINWLEEQKENELIANIGVSIYEKNDLEKTRMKIIDIIQLPLSIYDQRAVKNGLIKEVNKKGIKVQTRSLFLQGLILNDCKQWPINIDKNLKEHHIKWYKYLKGKNLEPLDACMNFCRSIKEIDSIVIGIDNKGQLDMIANKWNDRVLIEKDLSHEEWSSEYDIDPRQWKQV